MKWYDWLNPITWVLIIHWVATEIIGNSIILIYYKLKGGFRK